MQRFCCSLGLLFQNMTEIVLEKIVKEVKLKLKLLLYLGIGSHGECSAKLFGSHKPYYDGQ